MSTLPRLFTFRRCPYAIRARLALAASAVAYQPEEVVLRNKPHALLAASPKGTVPVLVLPDGQVLEQSLDIMLWALRQNDPGSWLKPEHGSLEALLTLIADLDQHFKPLLDRCKYPERYASQHSLADSRAQAVQWLTDALEARLRPHASQTPGMQPGFLFGSRISLADAAIFPFVRQFAAVDQAWWQSLPLPHLQHWRQYWLQLPLFEQVMQKPQAASPASAPASGNSPIVAGGA